MRRTATLFVLSVVSWLTFPAAVRADRPGSYDNVLQGGSSRTTAHDGSGHRRHQHCVPGRGSSLFFSVGAPLPYAYVPGFQYRAIYPGSAYWNYGIQYNPALNYTNYHLPPTYLPAELIYGPRAVRQFLGVDQAPLAAPPAAVAPAQPKQDIADKLRESNATSKERARRFLVIGDALFMKQEFHQAVQRYKSAITAAPDLPEAYYREAFALVAVNQYRLAAKALRIGVELDANMLRTDRLLDTLYGDNELVKQAHLERLADETLADPDNGDLYFLIGALLFATGENERATRFVQKAAELAKPGGDFLNALLAPLPADDARPMVELDT